MNNQDKRDEQNTQIKKNKYYIKIPKEKQQKRGVKKSNNPYEQIHILIKRVLRIVETIDELLNDTILKPNEQSSPVSPVSSPISPISQISQHSE